MSHAASPGARADSTDEEGREPPVLHGEERARFVAHVQQGLDELDAGLGVEDDEATREADRHLAELEAEFGKTSPSP